MDSQEYMNTINNKKANNDEINKVNTNDEKNINLKPISSNNNNNDDDEYNKVKQYLYNQNYTKDHVLPEKGY